MRNIAATALPRLVDHSLFTAFADEILRRDLVSVMLPQDISNLVWAYATARVSHPLLMGQLGDYMSNTTNIQRCKPQEITSFLWAMGTLRFSHPNALGTIIHHLLSADHLVDFGAPELGNTAWALVSLQLPHKPVFQAIASRFTHLPFPFPSASLAQTLWAATRAEAITSELWAAFTSQIMQLLRVGALPMKESAIVLWAAARQGVWTELVDCILANIFQHGAGQMIGLTITTILWSMTRLDLKDNIVLRLLASEAMQPNVLPTFDTQKMVMMCWAFAKLQYPDTTLLATFASRIVKDPELCQSMSPRHITMIYCAMAKACVFNILSLHAMANRALKPGFLRQFSPRELSNTLWALGFLNFRHPELLLEIARTILLNKVLDRFNSQSIANVLWALAKLRILHMPLILAIITRLVEPGQLQQFNAMELSSLAWSLAKLQLHIPVVLDSIVSCAVHEGTLPLFGTQETAVLVWSFAQVGYHHGVLLGAVATRVREPDFLPQCNPHELFLILDSFSAFGVRDNATVAALTASLLSDSVLPHLQPQDVATHCLALAHLGAADPSAIAMLNKHFQQHSTRISAVDATHMAWAMLVADIATDELLQPLMPCLIPMINRLGDEMPSLLAQMQQVLHSIVIRHEWSMANAALATIQPIVEKIGNLFARHSAHIPYSINAGSVLSSLQSLKVPVYEHKVLLEAGGYHVDLLWLDQQVVFEILDEAHLIKTEAGWHPNGGTILRWRHFAAAGFQVVPIVLFEWVQLETDDQRTAFLASKLQDLHLR
eukprot:GGOE01000990.1.p1 GENE.GGOE01000990.1~~GGOE01000990.1.p1  ORF type:complete len:776 (+),score=216.72 GGOE01000990.1:1569-3896(+)